MTDEQLPVGIKLDVLKEFILALESNQKLNEIFRGEVLTNMAIVSQNDLQFIDSGKVKLSGVDQEKLKNVIVDCIDEKIIGKE